MRIDDCVVWVRNSVSRPVVILENTNTMHISFGCFELNVLPKAPPTITVILGVNSVTLKDIFTVNNPASIKDNHQHSLKCIPTLMGLFCLWVVAVNTALITGDDPQYKVGIISGMLKEILADLDLVLFLLRSLEPGHKFGSNLVHVQRCMN